MTDYIEKKVYDFDERFSPLQAKYMILIRPFLRTALEEALLKGLELAEGAVPEVKVYDPVRGSNKPHVFQNSLNRVEGHNTCRREFLSRLAALKKEVMEGMEKVVIGVDFAREDRTIYPQKNP